MTLSNEYLIFDIETVPIAFDDRDIIDYLIAKQTDRSFHPFFAKIVAIGVKRPGQDPITWAADDEKQLLEEFWTFIGANRPRLFVSFNGMGFDVPFLVTRSIVHDVVPTIVIDTNKWRLEQGNHFDLMIALTDKWGMGWVKFEIMSRVMGIDIPADAIAGHQVADLHEAGDWDSIKKHNQQDLEITEQLFLKVRKFFF